MTNNKKKRELEKIYYSNLEIPYPRQFLAIWSWIEKLLSQKEKEIKERIKRALLLVDDLKEMKKVIKKELEEEK